MVSVGVRKSGAFNAMRLHDASVVMEQRNARDVGTQGNQMPSKYTSMASFYVNSCDWARLNTAMHQSAGPTSTTNQRQRLHTPAALLMACGQRTHLCSKDGTRREGGGDRNSIGMCATPDQEQRAKTETDNAETADGEPFRSSGLASRIPLPLCKSVRCCTMNLGEGKRPEIVTQQRKMKDENSRNRCGAVSRQQRETTAAAQEAAHGTGKRMITRFLRRGGSVLHEAPQFPLGEQAQLGPFSDGADATAAASAASHPQQPQSARAQLRQSRLL